MQEINILLSIDKNYIDKAMDVLVSIKQFNNVFLNVYLMHKNLTDEDLSLINTYLLNNNGKLNKILFSDTYDFPMFENHITSVTYYRLFFPFLIEKKIDRILYLDCDLICSGDIIEFYNTDFENNMFIACENMHISQRKDTNIVSNKALGLPEDNIYVNAGVLLINVNKYKKEVKKEELLQFIDDNKKILELQDQDVLNKYFYGKIKLADKKYNYQINCVDYGKEDFESIIFHYSEDKKPWLNSYEYPHKAIPYYSFLKRKGDLAKLEYLIKKHNDNNRDLLLRKFCDWSVW